MTVIIRPLFTERLLDHSLSHAGVVIISPFLPLLFLWFSVGVVAGSGI